MLLRGRIMCVPMRYSLEAIAAILICAASLFAQTSSPSSPQSLLLPQPIHVKGQVVEEDGRPIAGVVVMHAILKQELATGSDGRIEFDTVAPSFSLEFPGYTGERLQTRDAADFHVILRKSPRGVTFPVCSSTALASKTPGWNGVFQLPKEEGMEASSERIDVDYYYRAVEVKSGHRKVALEAGAWRGVGRRPPKRR